MTDQSIQDPEKIVAAVREQQEQLLSAGRTAWLELTDTLRETLSAVAEGQDKLAETTEVEWLSRILRAQATFARDLLEASSRFARDVVAD
jgi:hypothetical protein